MVGGRENVSVKKTFFDTAILSINKFATAKTTEGKPLSWIESRLGVEDQCELRPPGGNSTLPRFFGRQRRVGPDVNVVRFLRAAGHQLILACGSITFLQRILNHARQD